MDETLLSSYLAFSLSYVAAARKDRNLAEMVTPLIERLTNETLGKMETVDLAALKEEVEQLSGFWRELLGRGTFRRWFCSSRG